MGDHFFRPTGYENVNSANARTSPEIRRKRGLTRLALGMAVAVSALVAFPLSAEVLRYVDQSDPACSDTGPGTSTTPFCTIQRAGEVAIFDNTVIVAEGIYTDFVHIANTGFAGLPITFRPADGA